MRSSLNALLFLVLNGVSATDPHVCLLAASTTLTKLPPLHRTGVHDILHQGGLEQDLRSSEQLSLLLDLVSQQPGVSNATIALLRSFRPCAECKQHRRYGERHDGGYVMCDDDMQPGQLKAAYSYGINGFDGWANDISQKFKIPVFEYDCTNPKVPAKCPQCDLRFKLECINSNTAKPRNMFATLTQQLQRNGHSQVAQASLLLKIDVEGAEWSVFAEEPIDNLRKFREIIVEFHNLGDVGKHPVALRAVHNILRAGFAVNHIHGNNWAGEAHFGNYAIPTVLEVTYLQRSNAGSKCVDHSTLLPEDAVNNENVKELQTATLPMM